jgi:hypothetical protein
MLSRLFRLKVTDVSEERPAAILSIEEKIKGWGIEASNRMI